MHLITMRRCRTFVLLLAPRVFAAALLLACIVVGALSEPAWSAETETAPGKPNVIFIMADDK